jgi:hypothetical protein
MSIDCITDVMRRGRLRWYEHVQRGDTAWIKMCIDMEVDGRRSRGRPKMTWMKVMKKDMERCGLQMEDVSDRGGWRTKISIVR